MKHNKLVAFAGGLLAAAALFSVMLVNPKPAHAQAPAGFTLLSSVAAPTTTFTDSTVVDGMTYSYVVTSTDAAGESGPSNIATGSVPGTGTHTVGVSWTAPSAGTAPTGYNVYRMAVTVPNAPSNLTLSIN